MIVAHYTALYVFYVLLLQDCFFHLVKYEVEKLYSLEIEID